MFSKIYSKMKENIKDISYIFITSLTIAIILNIPVPYQIEAPGGLINLNDKVEVLNGYDSKGSLNLTYVSSYDGNVATYLMAKLSSKWDLVEDTLVENENEEDTKVRNKIMLENSLSNAYYVAYNYLNKQVDITSSNLYVIYVDKNANTDIKVGDKIVKVDDINVKDVDDIKSYINTKNVGDKVKFIVNDGDEKYAVIDEYDNNKSLLISVICNYNYDSDVKFNFEEGESGASGGLMIALSIYDQNTKTDLTKGYKIAGTGTIDKNGNVGEISGIKYKIEGVIKKDVDIFFVPYGNYEEAKKVVENNNYDINLVCIKTFSDAINYLTNEI